MRDGSDCSESDSDISYCETDKKEEITDKRKDLENKEDKTKKVKKTLKYYGKIKRSSNEESNNISKVDRSSPKKNFGLKRQKHEVKKKTRVGGRKEKENQTTITKSENLNSEDNTGVDTSITNNENRNEIVVTKPPEAELTTFLIHGLQVDWVEQEMEGDSDFMCV